MLYKILNDCFEKASSTEIRENTEKLTPKNFFGKYLDIVYFGIFRRKKPYQISATMYCLKK